MLTRRPNTTQGTNQARRRSRKRPDPPLSRTTGRDLPRRNCVKRHDQDNPSRDRDAQIGRPKNNGLLEE